MQPLAKVGSDILFFDLATTSTFYLQRVRDAASARRQVIDQAIGEFDGAIGGVIDALKEATGSLTATSSTVQRATEDTLRRMASASTASAETSQSVDLTVAATEELSNSIQEIGVLQPIVVRQIVDRADDGSVQYELVMGERRWRATQQAGLATVPAIVRDTADDALLRDALLENLHRSQLNPLEEAAAYQQLLDDFGCTHEELATRIGRSRPQISNTIRLLRLPPLVQRRVAAGVLSAGHARALLGLDDSAGMEALAQRIVAEGLSVRVVEEVVALGDTHTEAATPKKRPRAGGHRSELDDLASRLGDKLDTRVAIALGQRKGRLSIDFASVEDLNRILGLLSPDVRGVFAEG